jgi:hypothetical protein
MRVVGVVGAIVLALVTWVWLTFAPETLIWRQKLTLTVDTPQGEVSGSAVTEVRVAYFANPSAITGREVSYSLIGEATVVEVASGRYLFALITGGEERFAAAAKERFKGMTRGEWLRQIPLQTQLVTLTGDLIPTLVTFDDVSQPETVRLVEPDDLAASVGPGVGLTSVTLEITKEPVTVGRLDGLLGWLGPYPEPRLIPPDGRSTGVPISRSLSHGDFIRRPRT